MMEIDGYVPFEDIYSHLDHKDEVIEVEWNNINVAIRKIITVKEMVEVTDSVISSCISPSGDFIPEILPVVFRASIIMRYSNIQMPADIEAQSNLVYGSNVYEFICSHICIEQVTDIKESIYSIIKMK